MQTAIIEFARNVCGLDDSHSSEFAPECDNPVISLMESQQHVTDMGGTMRLGAYPCRLARGSRAAEIYGQPEVSERHRHRYEVSNTYRDLFVENGMRLSGLSPDGQLVEIVELTNHPWFIGCQFHPELQSRPTRPHPLFAGFIAAAAKAKQSHVESRAGLRIARRGRRLNVTRLTFARDALFLIAGPCVLEDDALNLRVGEHLARLAERVPGGIIYKASFDKANRSNAGAHRGPGLDEGLAALERVRAATGLPMLTDVHLPEQCAPAAEVVDVLQIPAFLCRQTDLLVAAGATGKAVNVKKGSGCTRKACAARSTRSARQLGRRRRASRCDDRSHRARHASSATAISSSTCASFVRMRAACDAPVIFDATHSVQRPGKGQGGSSGGAREFIPPLTLAALAAGADGLFMETHPDPDNAPSDGPNMIPLDQLDDLDQARRRHLGPGVAVIDPSARAIHQARRVRRRRRHDRWRHLPRRRRRPAAGVQALRDPGRPRHRHAAPRRHSASRSSPAASPRACGCARGAERRRRRAGSRRPQARRLHANSRRSAACGPTRSRSSATIFPTCRCCASSDCRLPSATPCPRCAPSARHQLDATRRPRRRPRVRRGFSQGARRVGRRRGTATSTRARATPDARRANERRPRSSSAADASFALEREALAALEERLGDEFARAVQPDRASRPGA